MPGALRWSEWGGAIFNERGTPALIEKELARPNLLDFIKDTRYQAAPPAT